MKKLFLLFMSFLVVLSLFGCSSSSGNSDKKVESVKVDTTEEVKEEPKKEEVQFEITNVYHDEYDADFGLGKQFKAIIEVKNTGNVPMYLDKCVLDYEDNDGHLLQTYDFMSKVPDIVQPNEKGYFYVNMGGSFDDDVDFSNGCNLVPNVYVEKAKGELKNYEVQDVTIFDGTYGGVGIKGRIINDTDKDVSMVYVRTVYYDANGAVLGISNTTVMDVRANSKTSFDDSGMFSGDFSVSDVASYDIYCDEMYMQF